MGNMGNNLRVADLFCGSGGMSEGFRLGGGKIVFGMDHNQNALDTFQFNHPNAKTIKCDATKLKIDDIPSFDILIGGPPCVNFSKAKGSRANLLEGLKLVQVFLKIVYERNPKYWVMENVPEIAKHLPRTIPLKWIGIDKKGELEVPTRHEFNCANYGVPQNRKRFLIGKYPIPEPTHQNPTDETLFSRANNLDYWNNLETVLNALPDPYKKHKSKCLITDPNFGFTCLESDLFDHFHPVTLDDEEVRRIRKAKMEHPCMGYMPFPDKTNRPARTVVATQLGRETLVLKGKKFNKKDTYRRATVRECATIQTFPLDYCFFGKSLSARYKQAGDAVPPLLTKKIMLEILDLEGVTNHYVEKFQKDKPPPPVKFENKKRKKTLLPLTKRFREMIPGKEVRGCRVDFDNEGRKPTQPRFLDKECLNIVQWVCRLHVGEGKQNKKERILTLEESLLILSYYARYTNTEEQKKCKDFVATVYKKLKLFAPDASSLQASYTNRHNINCKPNDIADLMSCIVNEFFPKDSYNEVRIHLLNNLSDFPNNGLRIRIAAGAVATAIACELINNGTFWLQKNTKKRYICENWPVNSLNFEKDIRSFQNPSKLFTRLVKIKKSFPTDIQMINSDVKDLFISLI